jgi:polyferredoxin
LQDSLATGSSTLIIDLMIPILVFAFMLLILGRAWCGWLCPLGFVQDLISRLRRALHINYYEISQRWADVLQRLKYVALFLIIWYSISLGLSSWGLNYFKLNKLPYFNMTLPLPYEQLDPNRALFVFPQMALGVLPMATVVPLLSLGAFAFFFVMSFMIRKFWCHICPAGAMNTPFNRLALLRISKDAEKCTHCRICLRVCPMEIEKVYEGRENDDVSSWKCVHCYRCVESCPEKDCLNVNFIGKKIISSKSFGG